MFLICLFPTPAAYLMSHNTTIFSLQELSYMLCYNYARATKVVSIPAPVYCDFVHHLQNTSSMLTSLQMLIGAHYASECSVIGILLFMAHLYHLPRYSTHNFVWCSQFLLFHLLYLFWFVLFSYILYHYLSLSLQYVVSFLSIALCCQCISVCLTWSLSVCPQFIFPSAPPSPPLVPKA